LKKELHDLGNTLNLPDKIWIMDKKAKLDLSKLLSPYLTNKDYCKNITVVGHPGIEKATFKREVQLHVID